MPKALKGTTVVVLVKKGLQKGFGGGAENSFSPAIGISHPNHKLHSVLIWLTALRPKHKVEVQSSTTKIPSP
jgi:hypothetical protein